MLAKIGFILCMLLALFFIVPIANQVIQTFTEEGGTFDQTFNSSDAAAWNTTGEILTSNQTAAIALTPQEEAFTQSYVWLIVIFIVAMIFFVLGRGALFGGGDNGGE